MSLVRTGAELMRCGASWGWRASKHNDVVEQQSLTPGPQLHKVACEASWSVAGSTGLTTNGLRPWPTTVAFVEPWSSDSSALCSSPASQQLVRDHLVPQGLARTARRFACYFESHTAINTIGRIFDSVYLSFYIYIHTTCITRRLSQENRQTKGQEWAWFFVVFRSIFLMMRRLGSSGGRNRPAQRSIDLFPSCWSRAGQSDDGMKRMNEHLMIQQDLMMGITLNISADPQT
jgi:hypothetical protein